MEPDDIAHLRILAGNDGARLFDDAFLDTLKLKLSEQTAKISTPGVLQVARFASGDELLGDAIHDEAAE